MACLYDEPTFEAQYTYAGSDLGATWSPAGTVFRLWAPTATAVRVRLYASGDPEAPDLLEEVAMTADARGTWLARKDRDLDGVYYTFLVTRQGETVEACDPYARTTGVNGHRAMVLNLRSTDPADWAQDRDPHDGAPITDSVIYELHIRDLSMDPQSGIVHKGKYLGLTETGTHTPQGIPTGLDHIRSLGVTHVHLLPMFDFGSVDEAQPHLAQFNWGYDPMNFNTPEGSYATDARNGRVRVAELKQAVRALHENGLSIVMDVVYNHVFHREQFCFNRIVPDYFSRVSPQGLVSDGSCCGNDTASERAMVRKFLVDSLVYWADEYHIDGFRFDLVGLIDTQTIRAAMAAVHRRHPNVIFYGEGWTMDTHPTQPDVSLTTQTNAHLVPGFAFFSDTLRDTLRGSVWINDARGFLTGQEGLDKALEACLMAETPWCQEPGQMVNYASCHDNMALFDRIRLSAPEQDRQTHIAMNLLSAAICLTAQGIPFFQAGEEMLRSKPLPGGGYDHNSYCSPDQVNCLKWGDLAQEEYRQVTAYYRGLIAFRKAHAGLRLPDHRAIAACVRPVATQISNVLALEIRAPGDTPLYQLYNGTAQDVTLPLPPGDWDIYVNHAQAGTHSLGRCRGTATLRPYSALALAET